MFRRESHVLEEEEKVKKKKNKNKNCFETLCCGCLKNEVIWKIRTLGSRDGGDHVCEN